MIAKKIKKHLEIAVKKLGLSAAEIELEHPAEEAHGDYATNVALQLARIPRKGNFLENIHKKKGIPAGTAVSPILASLDKLGSGGSRFSTLQDTQVFYTKLERKSQEDILTYKERKSSMEWAEGIVKSLPKIKEIEKIEIKKPGFINFWLSKEYLLKEVKRATYEGDKFGSGSWGAGKTLVIDYSSPNIAKRFSIGHLRSTIIGQALYNLYKFLGWKVIGDNHLGDWGTQFGKLIVVIDKWSKKPPSELNIDEMEQLYVKFHQKAEENPSLDKEARHVFKKLEDGSKKERKMWEQLVDASMKEFQRIYDLLGVKIDVNYGESFYEDIMPDIIKEAKRKKIAVESKGALIIHFPTGKLPPGMLLKSDGATTYFTRDLATIKFRKDKWGPDLAIYEVGAEQAVHFRQVFWAAELLGLGERGKFVHVPHGLIRLKEGKISTRKGRTIKLEEVLHEAIKKAKEFNANDKVAKAVGIGAVKYNDLKKEPTTDYIFDWKEVLNLEGNSGPYLQYTYARCKSVLRKAGSQHFITIVRKNVTFSEVGDEEMAILRTLYKFPEVVYEAGKNYSPNLICNFLFDLAQKYNLFYQKIPILKAQSQKAKAQRLLLTKATAQVLKNGLHLLGIRVLERM